MAKKVWISILIGLLIAGWQADRSCAEVIIKIRALNPLNSKETAVINYFLPKKVSESDIIRQKITYSMDHSEEDQQPKQSFKISFDDQKEAYYVDDEVVLMPKEVVTLEVHVNDVWVIDQSQIQGLKEEVDGILEDWEQQLKETAEAEAGEQENESGYEDETKEFALIMKGEIVDGLDVIIKRQDENKIIDVGVERHIAAYEDNVEVLRQVQQDIVLLANLIEFEGEEEGEETQPEQEQDLEGSKAMPDIVQDEPSVDTEIIENLASEEQEI